MQHQWVILKFGGSSVADPRHWQTIGKVTKSRIEEGYRPLLVLSALKNVSNALEALLHQALAGVHSMAIVQLKELHLGFASRLGLDANDLLAPWFKHLNELCRQIQQSGEITPPVHAQVLSIGELLSTTIGAKYLSTQQLDVDWLDARGVLKSHNRVDLWHHYTSAECDYSFDESLTSQLSPKAQVIVTQGFIATDENNDTVLLGREGSDTSAAYFGAKLAAARIEIWTDVPGVFSANPREIPKARQLPSLSYRQAQQMALLGAKVLHPRAIAPAERYQIPLWVKSTSLPDHKGTAISSAAHCLSNTQVSVIAVASEAKISWLQMPENTQPKLLDAGISLLSAEGFDQIICFNQGKKKHYILSYKNSDRPQPDDKVLQEKLALPLASLTSKLTLISLFSDCEDFAENTDKEPAINQGYWNEELSKFMTNLALPTCQLFSEFSPALVSVLLDSSDALKVSRALHRQFVENNSTGHRFGADWSTFQE